MTEAVKKGGGFLGGLKSLLVDEVPDAPSKTPPAPVAQSTAPNPMNRTSSIPSTPFVPVQPPTIVQAADPQALAKLEAKLSASLPPVYAAFMEQYEQLREVIPDDGMRFKAALKTSKATPEQLAGAVDQLLQTMQNAAAEFTGSFDAKKNSVIGQAQTSIKGTEDLIVSREQQREAMDKEIASLRARLQTDTEHMQSEDRRFEGIRAGFAAAHAQVMDRLNAQKAHIVSQPKG